MKVKHFIIGLSLAVAANLIAMYIYDKLKKKSEGKS